MGKQKRKWTTEETEALCAGVEKHGHKWRLIQLDPQFDSSLDKRSNIDLKDKWRNLAVRNRPISKYKVKTHRRNYKMHPSPLSSKKRSKMKLIEELSDSEDHDNPCTFTRQRRGTHNNTIDQDKKLNSERDYLMHPSPLSSIKRSKMKLIEELTDSENYDNPCTVTRQRRGTRNNTIDQDKKLNSEKVQSYMERDTMMHPSPLSSKKRNKKKLIEELSDSENYDNPCTLTRQRRGTRGNTIDQDKKLNSERDNLMRPSLLSIKKRNKKKIFEVLSDFEDYDDPCTVTRQRRGTRGNTIDQDKKLNSEKVHSYLENLWLSFPEDKKSSFTHLDPLWYNLYSNDSNKEKVLNWIKKKDIFSRKYVFFPIVQWGHWSVLIFCHFGESLGSKLKTPCILLLDSLAKTDHSKQLEPVIRKFVLDMYENLESMENIKLLRKMPFLVPKVPQQRDNKECGFYVLYYIKLFVESAPENFSISNGYPYFMKKDWFTSEGLDSFCKTLDSSHV